MRKLLLLLIPVCIFTQCKNTDKIVAPEGYQLVWNDEFDGDSVDPDKWIFMDWPPGRVNQELQRYVPDGELDGIKTAYVKDGILNISAVKHGDEVISARMNTNASWKYGIMEARIKLPVGKGTWPAYWMMPSKSERRWPACGEIDILEEVGYHPDYPSSSFHSQKFNHVKGIQIHNEIYLEGAESDFHIYTLKWTENNMTTYFDGQECLSYDNDGSGDDAWPFNKAFYITLNLAWGGGWGGRMGVDESALPATMQVDYVRVFQEIEN